MVKIRMAYLAALALSLAAGSCRAASGGGSLMATVRAVEGKHDSTRRDVVIALLRDAGVEPLRMLFVARDTSRGENLIVRLGSGLGTIVVGAHYDAVPEAPGANDNGSGVAVLLELIRTLKGHAWKHRVEFCFFDREEDGLFGSRAYVRQRDTAQPFVGMINLDVEGTGSEIYVGPVGGGDDERIMRYVRAARDSLRYAYTEDSTYPGSDYEPFAEAKLENISISVTPPGDAVKLSRWVKSGYRPITNREDFPEVLEVMHTARDSSTYLTPEALGMSYAFTRLTLLLLDEGER